jgi:hypothetical protein
MLVRGMRIFGTSSLRGLRIRPSPWDGILTGLASPVELGLCAVLVGLICHASANASANGYLSPSAIRGASIPRLPQKAVPCLLILISNVFTSIGNPLCVFFL